MFNNIHGFFCPEKIKVGKSKVGGFHSSFLQGRVSGEYIGGGWEGF